MMVLSDFCLEDSSTLDHFSTLLSRFQLDYEKPGLLLICGQFLKKKKICNKEDNQKVLGYFKNFMQILETYSDIIKDINIGLVPGKLNNELKITKFFLIQFSLL